MSPTRWAESPPQSSRSTRRKVFLLTRKKELRPAMRARKRMARYQLPFQKVKEAPGPRSNRGSRKIKRKETRMTTLKRIKIVLNFIRRRSYNRKEVFPRNPRLTDSTFDPREIP
jgi:hypothetical protein